MNYKTIFVFLIIIATSCVFYYTDVKTIDTQQTDQPVKIKAPTKAHLSDGSVIIFRDGFEARNDTLFGLGVKHNFTRNRNWNISNVPMDSIQFLEYYQNKFDGLTFITSVPMVAFSSLIIFKALFGSCPTIYSSTHGKEVLEAECFSYSISPRYESFDLDKIHFPDINEDHLDIAISNEALETHYINQLNLIQVNHPAAYSTLPNGEGDVVLIGKSARLIFVNDKIGRDVSSKTNNADGDFYESEKEQLRELNKNITRDWIECTIANPGKRDKVAITLKLRNTLLNTVLLYDIMLGSKGIEVLNWLDDESQGIIYAYQLNQWYKKHFGLEIQVLEDGEYETVKHIWDTGPIAWHEQAELIDIPETDSVHIRLSFTPDNWQIDKIGCSFDILEDIDQYELVSNELKNMAAGAVPNQNKELLHDDDDNYLITYPGDHYKISFRITPPAEDGLSSFFIKSKGYYIEWIRKEWIKNSISEDFEFNDETIMYTAKLWLDKKEGFEQLFYDMKIPLKQSIEDE